MAVDTIRTEVLKGREFGGQIAGGEWGGRERWTGPSLGTQTKKKTIKTRSTKPGGMLDRDFHL